MEDKYYCQESDRDAEILEELKMLLPFLDVQL